MVLVTISLCVRSTRVKVRVIVDRQCRGRQDTKCNDRQSYRATINFTGSIFFPFALCCNTRINIFCFRKPTSRGSSNCKYGIFEGKYICSYEWSYWSGIRGATWVSSSLFHKVRKGGQQPACHRPALLPLQIIYSHTTPKQTQGKVKPSDTLHTHNICGLTASDCLVTDYLTSEESPHPMPLNNLIFSEKSNYPGYTRTLTKLITKHKPEHALSPGPSQAPALWYLTQLLAKISPE